VSPSQHTGNSRGRPYTPTVDATLQDPLVGRELDGRYLVRSRIAQGGMATVYLALDTRLDRDVALKVMHAHLAGDAQFTARFVREARAAARLSHPNVVQVYDQGAEGDVLYLAMERLLGRTLREVLTERRVLTAREALTVLEPLLDALAAAHRLGIVHRDVKPENVILTDDGRVKVADFGLARAATTNTSTTGVLLGTVGYLSPELVARGAADARSDVYAAGIMLFEMLTGRLPFVGGAPIQVAYQHVNDEVPAPSTLAPEVDPQLDELVGTATARDPDDRPADAGELLTLVRDVHARLAPAQLDARPAPPAGVRAPGGAATEVFAQPVTHHQTRALPDLTGDLAALVPRRVPQADLIMPPGPDDDAADDAADDAEAAALATLLRRRRKIGVSALLTVLVLALGLAGTAGYFALGPGAYTPTPDVFGRTVADARNLLKAQGLRSTETAVFDDAAGAGIVVSTKPDRGRPVRKDGAVELRVSRGPEFVTVPPVVGRTEKDAREALEAAHLAVDRTEQKFDDKPAGQVIAADPHVGDQARNGTPVTLTVSKGPEPVQVPDVVKRSKDEAEAALRAVRLKPAYGEPVFDDTIPEGFVVSQTPADATLLPGNKVTLVLSKGPELVPVPSVVAQQFGQAKATLEAQGFKVRRVNVLGGVFGTVRVQLPGGGVKAPKGSTVVLTVV
jgi:beta-lactam-binding protein with PASTA domain